MKPNIPINTLEQFLFSNSLTSHMYSLNINELIKLNIMYV